MFILSKLYCKCLHIYLITILNINKIIHRSLSILVFCTSLERVTEKRCKAFQLKLNINPFRLSMKILSERNIPKVYGIIVELLLKIAVLT